MKGSPFMGSGMVREDAADCHSPSTAQVEAEVKAVASSQQQHSYQAFMNS